MFTWLWLRTGGNLLLAIVLHTAMNNSARLLPNTGPAFGLMIGVIVTVLITEKMWRRRDIGKLPASAVPLVDAPTV